MLSPEAAKLTSPKTSSCKTHDAFVEEFTAVEKCGYLAILEAGVEALAGCQGNCQQLIELITALYCKAIEWKRRGSGKAEVYRGLFTQANIYGFESFGAKEMERCLDEEADSI